MLKAKKEQLHNEVQSALDDFKVNGDDASPESYYLMGQCIRHGFAGLGRDKKLARSLLEKASELGHLKAAFEVARNYMRGNSLMDTEKDLEKAKEVIEKALDAGKNSSDSHTRELLEEILQRLNESENLHVGIASQP